MNDDANFIRDVIGFSAANEQVSSAQMIVAAAFSYVAASQASRVTTLFAEDRLKGLSIYLLIEGVLWYFLGVEHAANGIIGIIAIVFAVSSGAEPVPIEKIIERDKIRLFGGTLRIANQEANNCALARR